MASAATAIDRAANPKTMDESLWWDSFDCLLNDIENAPLSTDIPTSLVKKIKSNHAWFLDTVSLFKPPNQSSRDSLESSQINVGSHELIVQPELKDVALQASSCLGLDEVQSYILVKRSAERSNLAVEEFIHLIVIQYYIERQCLLKCTRQILMQALYVGSGFKEGSIIREEALQLISNGLERKLLSALQDLLLSKHPEHMEVDLANLWAEETMIEVCLVLDILFLSYYESFCACNGEQWKRLCSLYKGILSGSFHFGKLKISVEARNTFCHTKIQLLLILIETLDLESLLQMVRDQVPFSQGHSAFSLTDVQEMDAIISSFNAFETEESGPLILAWAVFLCLISSLLEKQDNNVIMEIDHVGYVHQAFEAAALSYFLEILQSDILKDSDHPVVGYRSVLRTFISAFIASYEITNQLGDSTLNLILDILCKIYRGEESLCVQFWDRDSFIDGPIRCLLCSLEGEFPVRTVELVRFLSALCEGNWPAECVYKFLDKSVGISSLLEIPSDFILENNSPIIETRLPIHLPGVEGFFIPSHTHGHVLKMIDGNTALIRWEYSQSGLLVLLLRLAQEFHLNGNEEVLVTLDMLSRLVSFSTAVCHAVMHIGNPLPLQDTCTYGQLENIMKVDVVKIICTSLRNLSPNGSSATLMSMGINILGKMLKCSPSYVSSVVLKTNIFDVGSYDSSSGMWSLSGGLARMLLIDSEQNDNCCSLTISVLDFTMQLVEKGVEDDIVLALVVFSLQYILVNHEYWKYKMKHVRWNVTLKALEVLKKCILCIPHLQKLGGIIRDILLGDSSIHSTLCRIMCVTTPILERLYISRIYELKEIEGLQLALCSVLDIVVTILSDLSKDTLFRLSAFHQAMVSSSTKPIPVVMAVISLISFFRNPAIQEAAARVLSMLCITADNSPSYLFGNVCFVPDDAQITDLRNAICDIISEETPYGEDLIIAVLQLLTSAASHQPAFLNSILAIKEIMEVPHSIASSTRRKVESYFGSLRSKKASMIDLLLLYLERCEDLIQRNPQLLLNVLKFVKALWQRATQYAEILGLLRNSNVFWKHLSSILAVTTKRAPLLNHTGKEILSLSYTYQCQSAVLEIMAYEIFLQKRQIQDELLVKQVSEPSEGRQENAAGTDKVISTGLPDFKDILSNLCEGSIVANLIKSYTSCENDGEIYRCAKIAASLFILHVMGKLAVADAGSLSLPLLKMINDMSRKLSNLPGFSELLTQYSRRGYSEGKQLNTLILEDLYYHLQGELEGRKINPGPFKELSLYLLESKNFQTHFQKHHEDLSLLSHNMYLFDLMHLHADLGLEFWDHSDWKASKAIAQKMLHHMQDANLMASLTSSKLSALKALLTTLAIMEENPAKTKKTSIVGEISEPFIESSIVHICKCLQTKMESILLTLDASEDTLNFIAAQAVLLLHLVRSLHERHTEQVNRQLFVRVCILVLKTSGTGLQVLSGMRQSTEGFKQTVKILLLLILMLIQFSYLSSHLGQRPEMESSESFVEVAIASLGLLPILCNYVEVLEYFTLSLAAINLILKGFLTCNTWLPIIQKHLQFQFVVQRLQDKDSLTSIPMVLKFLLTLAQVRAGAELLLSVNFFSSLKVLFSFLLDEKILSDGQNEKNFPTSSDKVEKPEHIWGLGLSVVTAMINSLEDSSAHVDVVDSVISYFSEKGFMISAYLRIADFPSDDHDKKKICTQITISSLSSLRETEQTLILVCVLAKHWNSWIKAMKEIDSQLRERSIHLLAFISRGAQRLGESPSRTAPLLCHPTLKEELEFSRRPSFISSRHGWFSLFPLGCVSKSKVSAASSTAFTTLAKDQATGDTESNPQTYFSDVAAIQIYRIAFLLLKFLCLQAEGASKRSEEIGFIDLAHFPELPMPEILHGLQDQAIYILIDLSEANKLKQIHPEIQQLCFLLVKIMEKALYLEFCVLQACGIRPVLGRVEDFSKQITSLMQVMEEHAFLRPSVGSLKQIISLIYPGLLQTEA